MNKTNTSQDSIFVMRLVGKQAKLLITFPLVKRFLICSLWLFDILQVTIYTRNLFVSCLSPLTHFQFKLIIFLCRKILIQKGICRLADVPFYFLVSWFEGKLYNTNIGWDQSGHDAVLLILIYVLCLFFIFFVMLTFFKAYLGTQVHNSWHTIVLLIHKEGLNWIPRCDHEDRVMLLAHNSVELIWSWLLVCDVSTFSMWLCRFRDAITRRHSDTESKVAASQLHSMTVAVHVQFAL